MSCRTSCHVWLPLWALLIACLTASPAQAEDLLAERTEFAVGETVTLKIPDALGLIRPKWRANPAGVIEFTEKGRAEAKVKGVGPGRVEVSAKVDWKLGSTTYVVSLHVTAGTGSRIKAPAAATGGAEPQRQAGLDDTRMLQIGELLKRYETELGSIRELFDKTADKNRTPAMGELTARRLTQITEKFFRELGDMGLDVRDLQRFKEQFKAAGPGGNPLFPGQGAWDDAFLATERALMMGRSQLVQHLWMETLQDTFRHHPDAAVFGEIDIGSWVKMRLGDLGFQADIDFSSVSIDPDLNRWIVDRFESKLRQHTSLDMVQADALLTPHGQASADVFIGDWGKTYAELDMLNRSKWKVIKVEKNPDGSLALDENGRPRIRLVEKPGAQLFWEVAFRKLEAGQFAEVEFPKMDLAKEPMLSLEMLRHGIHDIEHGPYSRGQKLIKMLKYAERSYSMSKRAVAEYGFNPYAANDPLLAQAAEKIIANKNDPEMVADLLRALSGEDITAENVEAVTAKLVARAKTAMHDNAARALAFRLNAIARIDSDAERQKAAEKLWTDLGTELDTFRETAGEPPRIMVEAQEMAKAVMEGKLPPAELEAKANALHKLLNEAYKLPDSVIDRILMSDSVLKLKAYLRKLGWVEKSIDEFAKKARQKFPNVADFHRKVVELNEQLEKTTSGSALLRAADWADNAFTVYEAYFDSDASDALFNAAIAMGRVGAQSFLPSMQIPFAIYDSFKTGSPKPLGMAVAFMYFPFAGQTYMVSGLLQRADVGIRDAEFYDALNRLQEITEFDTQGKIIAFRLKGVLGREIDSASISPPGNRKAIVDLFTRPESTFYTSPNFRYWSSLVPKRDDRFGRYEDKLQKLRRFFGLSEEVRYMTVMLENFKANTDALPQDKYTAQRRAALERMEEQLTETLWTAIADMLESAARSVSVAELEAKVKRLEMDLALRDDDLGKNKGLMSRIQWEIRQNSSLLGGVNPYAVGLIYDKYIKGYERVEDLRKRIVQDVWQGGFDIDYVAAQSKPMKILLLGGRSGAPALSGDPVRDVELAENTQDAHRKRAASIRADLAAALGRPLDPNTDKEHLKALGQIGLEWEHLLDDCAGRAAPNCEAGVREALQQRVKLYKEYLASLTAANQAILLEVTGPAELRIGDNANYGVKFARAEDATRPDLVLSWSINGKAAGRGTKLNVKAERPGPLSLYLSVSSKTAGGDKKLGEATRIVNVKADAVAKSGGVDKSLDDEIAAALRSRDWKRLADRLDAEKNSPTKLQNPTAWQAGVDALTKALDTLKKERMQWAFGAEEYLRELDNVDASVWDKLTRQVEKKRQAVEERCFQNTSSSEAYEKRKTRCQNEGRQFETNCLSTWPDRHRQERVAIRLARQEVPEQVHTLHSAGYFSHRAWFEAVEKMAEQYRLPFPFPKPVVPRLNYSSISCASVDLPGAKPGEGLSLLKVTVFAPEASVPIGRPVSLNASASGGKPPYRFTWSTGATGERASVTPGWAGEWTVTVAATDAEGKTGEGRATLRVSPRQVKLLGTQPRVFYGSQATLSLHGEGPPPPVADPCAGRNATNPFDECLRIDVKDLKAVSTASPGYVPPASAMVHDVSQVQALPEIGSAARAGKQRVIWQAEPAVGFMPTASDDGRTRVTYSRMGQVKLWCEIQEMIEGAYHTVGECEQETVEVVAPKFSLTFTPPEGQGRIGQDIRLHVASEPSVPDELIDFRWFDPATSNRQDLTPNAREIGFRVKDTKPVALKALARVPHHGDEIAELSATYTGVGYEVKIHEPKGYGPPLQVWVCDTQLGYVHNCGMRPVSQGQFATFQDIFLKSEVTPTPPSPRYRWSVDPPGSCGLPGSGSELRLNCSNTGSYTVRLQVLDADDILLGQAERTLSVSVSDNDVKQAPKSKEAWEKMQQAKQRANAGQLDMAITLAGSAAELDPRNTEAKDLHTRWIDERNTVRQQLDRARKALQANKPDDAQKQVDAAKKLHPNYPPVLDVEKQIADKRKAQGIRGGLPVDTSPAGATATAGGSQPVSLASVGGRQGTPRTVKGVSIDDSSWIRFKSTDENRRSLDIPIPSPIRAAAVVIVSNLDDATYLEQGKTIARIIVAKDTGDEVLGIQAGVHSSEWNYGVGPKHRRVDSADIGDSRFLVVLPLSRPGMVKGLRVEYVETDAPKWAGHAPGFVLRGVSLVADTTGLTLTPAGASSLPADKATPIAGRINLARGKPASQSSTSQWSRSNDAQGAVDGVIDGSYGFHTDNQAYPWWQVDLGGNARIDEVRVYNRLDCCAERARTLQVMLSDDGRQWRTVFRHNGAPFGGKDGRPLSVVLGGAPARYVRLQLNERNWFHLDEVEVYGQMMDAGTTPTQPGVRDHTWDTSSGTVTPTPTDSTIGSAPAHGGGKMVLEDDVGPYTWIEATQVQTARVRSGRAAFRSTGNNYFTHRLGVVGNYPGQYRYLDLWLWFDKPGADIQIQVQVDGVWGKRWGFEAGPKYDGYGWAMEGTTVNQTVGQWVNVRLDLIEQLHIHAGQAITGLAFSSDHGDVYYDAVYLQPNPNPVTKPSFQPVGKQVLEDDAGPYRWVEATEVQDYLVFRGNRAFRSTGNNYFTADLGVAGNGAGQFRSLGFWAFFMGPQADIQLQVQVNGVWGKRWGFEAGPKYDGYGWAMEGTTANMPNGRWTWVQVDLLNQLNLHAGDRITGLAFSSDHGDVIYDSVWLLPAGTAPVIGQEAAADEPVIPGGRDYTGTPTQTSQLIFEVGNIGGTLNGPTRATTFSLDRPHMITLIRNYHWNGAWSLARQHCPEAQGRWHLCVRSRTITWFCDE